MKIAVLCGGLSNERDVSISSGTGIARALRQRGHRVALVDLFLGAEGDEAALRFRDAMEKGGLADLPGSCDEQSGKETVRPEERCFEVSSDGHSHLQLCVIFKLDFKITHFLHLSNIAHNISLMIVVFMFIFMKLTKGRRNINARV